MGAEPRRPARTGDGSAVCQAPQEICPEITGKGTDSAPNGTWLCWRDVRVLGQTYVAVTKGFCKPQGTSLASVTLVFTARWDNCPTSHGI